MILVIGSTGFLGFEICRQLRERGEDVVALVRATSDAEKKARLRAIGAETRVGDLRDDVSLRAACQGIDAVISTANTLLSRADGDTIEQTDRQGALSLVDIAVASGVRKFVYVSISGNVVVVSPFLDAKREVEQRLIDSGIDYTILRPSCFMEVHLAPIASGHVRVFGNGDAPISWISLRDVAAFAVESLRNPAARNAVLEIGGAEALSHREVVGMFEDVIGRPLAIDSVPLQAIEQQYAFASDPVSKSFAALALGSAQGDAIDMTETLQRIPIRLCSVREFAGRVGG